MPHASVKFDNTIRPWRPTSRAGRLVRDCAAALTAFAVLAAVIGWNSLPPQPIATGDVLAAGASHGAKAQGAPFLSRNSGADALNAALPLPQLGTRALAGPTDRMLVVTVLASVFSAIIAFNLWFLRHLGRVYASPRPGGGRRG